MRFTTFALKGVCIGAAMILLAACETAPEEQANTGGTGRISAAGSPVSVWVVPTDEERMIARHTQAALSR